MRIQRAPLFKLAACFAVLALLLGVATAGAVERDERVSKDPNMAQNRFHFKSIGTGKNNGTPSFFKMQGSSECASDCCWAYASCDGAFTSCSSTGCYASCASGLSSYTPCNLNN
jgi:hypothetical protein